LGLGLADEDVDLTDLFELLAVFFARSLHRKFFAKDVAQLGTEAV
jgi:hypothetical protein